MRCKPPEIVLLHVWNTHTQSSSSLGNLCLSTIIVKSQLAPVTVIINTLCPSLVYFRLILVCYFWSLNSFITVTDLSFKGPFWLTDWSGMGEGAVGEIFEKRLLCALHYWICGLIYYVACPVWIPQMEQVTGAEVGPFSFLYLPVRANPPIRCSNWRVV